MSRRPIPIKVKSKDTIFRMRGFSYSCRITESTNPSRQSEQSRAGPVGARPHAALVPAQHSLPCALEPKACRAIRGPARQPSAVRRLWLGSRHPPCRGPASQNWSRGASRSSCWLYLRPPVAEVWRRQPQHWNKLARTKTALAPLHYGHRKPSGQRRLTKYARRPSSVEKRSSNSWTVPG